MYFALDIICVLIIAGMAIRFWSSALSSVILRGLCVLLGALIAIVATVPLAHVANTVLVRPIVEQTAANELADMVSGEHLSTGRETASHLNLTRLMQDQPPAFTEWVERYHADLSEATQAYNNRHNGSDLLIEVTEGYSLALSRSGCFAVLWVACVLLLLLIARRIELNMAPPSVRTTGAKIGAPLLGALTGVLIVMGLTVLLEWMVPYMSGRSLLFPTNMLTAGTAYPILKYINPFLGLWSLIG